MYNKHCHCCGEDLTEIGVYVKSYQQYKYDAETGNFYFEYEDVDGIYCGNCDAYVDVNLVK